MMEEKTGKDLKNIDNWLNGVTKPVRRVTMNIYGDTLSSQIWGKNAPPFPKKNMRGTRIIKMIDS